ncbi:major facilitator superfamily domain-containing protein [Xylariales sp. PMI_506]|nr:major facilitator superfamily domain-containing protein [Xylariales sp. PMI_506]
MINTNQEPSPNDVEAAGDVRTGNGNSDQLDDQSSRLPFRRLMVAYACLAVIYFISTLDINSVATALPVISRSLSGGSGGGGSLTWAGTAYLMGQTSCQALYGRLSDIFGRKPVLLASIAFLIVGDLLCSAARTPTWLYACRALSGVGGGGISSLVQITVSDLVSLQERGKYQGMLSAAIGLGAGVGPLIAAAVVVQQQQSGGSSDGDMWRWIFRIPPLLAAPCAVMLWLALPLRPVAGSWGKKLRQIDWFGLVAAMAAILLLLVSAPLDTVEIPLNSGGTIWPWHSTLVIALMSTGGLFVILFVIIEKRFAKLPIIPPRLFSQLSTAILLFQSGLYDSVWQVDLYFIPIYFQDVQGFSPMRSALLTLPLLLSHSAMGVVSGPIMARTARYGPVLYTGMALWVLGAGLKVIFSRDTAVWVYVVVLIVEGAGIGWVHQPALVALQALAQNQDRAVATSTRNLMRMLGAVAGMASCTAIQSAVMEAALPAALPSSIRDQVVSGTWERGQSGSASWDSDILDAKMKAIRVIFIVLVPLVATCLLGCYFIPNEVLPGDSKLSPPAPRSEENKDRAEGGNTTPE